MFPGTPFFIRNYTVLLIHTAPRERPPFPGHVARKERGGEADEWQGGGRQTVYGRRDTLENNGTPIDR